MQDEDIMGIKKIRKTQEAMRKALNLVQSQQNSHASRASSDTGGRQDGGNPDAGANGGAARGGKHWAKRNNKNKGRKFNNKNGISVDIMVNHGPKEVGSVSSLHLGFRASGAMGRVSRCRVSG